MALKQRNGSNYHDMMFTSADDDLLLGRDGDDYLLDAGRRGQVDADMMNGGRNNDYLRAWWGSDILRGDMGNDVLVSRSDAGEPSIAQDPALGKVSTAALITASNDALNGGVGADKFLFRLDLNARADVLARHTGMSGEIDWHGVHDDGTDAHNHWVEGIGTDVIQDFFRNEGDRIVIEGNSVMATIEYADSDKDGRNDMSVIRLRSDQGGMGAHQGDLLGIIKVFGDKVMMDDLIINPSAGDGGHGMDMGGDTMDMGGVYHGVAESIDDHLDWVNTKVTIGDDVLRTISKNASLNGRAGNDYIIDGSRKGEVDRDTFDGGEGNDVLRARWGNDLLRGGNGDDILVSRADTGEPVIAQETKVQKVFANEPYLQSSDTMIGGLGADTFYFRLDLNARLPILLKHTDDLGYINWHGVAGENSAVHLHWVEGIGTDVIKDFYREDGDKIVIEGHTTMARIYYADTNGDHRDDMSIIVLKSNQGGAGSHDTDHLGAIKVYGDLVKWDDITVDAGVHYGVTGTIDEWATM